MSFPSSGRSVKMPVTIMHMSRAMKRIARELQAEDPDCFKVRNDDPAKEFAFDLAEAVEIRQFGEMTEEELAEKLLATDDFGKPVTHVPVGQTSATVFLDFAKFGLKLPFTDAQVPVSDFVRAIGSRIDTEVRHPEDRMGAYIPRERIQRMRLKRLFWDAGLESWTLVWAEEPMSPLSNQEWRWGLTRMRDAIRQSGDSSLLLQDALSACVLVLDCDYPQMAAEGWNGLTQLVYDEQEEDHYLNSPEREQHALAILRGALPAIESRLAALPEEDAEI